jgi:lipopolysaccharide export system permease protein
LRGWPGLAWRSDLSIFFFNQFSGALAKAGVIPLFAAAWVPAVVALLSGMTLLLHTEDG